MSYFHSTTLELTSTHTYARSKRPIIVLSPLALSHSSPPPVADPLPSPLLSCGFDEKGLSARKHLPVSGGQDQSGRALGRLSSALARNSSLPQAQVRRPQQGLVATDLAQAGCQPRPHGSKDWDKASRRRPAFVLRPGHDTTPRSRLPFGASLVLCAAGHRPQKRQGT